MEVHTTSVHRRAWNRRLDLGRLGRAWAGRSGGHFCAEIPLSLTAEELDVEGESEVVARTRLGARDKGKGLDKLVGCEALLARCWKLEGEATNDAGQGGYCRDFAARTMSSIE